MVHLWLITCTDSSSWTFWCISWVARSAASLSVSCWTRIPGSSLRIVYVPFLSTGEPKWQQDLSACIWKTAIKPRSISWRVWAAVCAPPPLMVWNYIQVTELSIHFLHERHKLGPDFCDLLYLKQTRKYDNDDDGGDYFTWHKVKQSPYSLSVEFPPLI